MAKQMVCETVICKVNGVTLLRLDNNNTLCNGGHSRRQRFVHKQEEEDNKEMIVDNDYDNVDGDGDGDDNDEQRDDSDSEYATICEETGKVFEMEKVDTSIESVRQYVLTTRKNGKVWHQCRWAKDRPCSYGSKWSGAMVNHIRSHLGIKPFRCPFCDKDFTIACNLKNHLRIHHNLKTKITLNGGRRVKGMVKTNEKTVAKRLIITGKHKPNDKLRVFKPCFVNGKANSNAYAPEKRVLPKRNVKKNQKYADFEEDFDDEEIEDNREEEEEEQDPECNDNYNEEEAEEENRMFYENTKEEKKEEEEEEEEEDDDFDGSRYLTRRQYNKVLWWVCLWSPRQCKYRSHEKQEVLNHIQKHQNLNRFTCNDCGLSFANRQVLDSHLLSHARHRFLKCNQSNCLFQTINELAMKMHKLRHKRQK